jgi:hypothetical protein
MARTRTFDSKLVGYQERQLNAFTEPIELKIPAGKKTANFPADQDFKSDKTKIFGIRAYVNNANGTGKSFISGTKLLPQDVVASCAMEIFENNTDKIYTFPLEKIVGQFNCFQSYCNIFINGYSSKESRIVLAEPLSEDVAVLIEFIYE